MSTPDNSQITLHSGGGFTATGPDAIKLMGAIMLKQALKLYAKTGMQMSRNISPTAMLTKAGRLCGKTYKRGQYDLAANDVEKWCETMKAAMPVSED